MKQSLVASSPQDGENKARIIGFEVLKIIALLGAVALHTQRSSSLGVCWNPLLYYLSRFCMPVFFMVNGALIMSKDTFTFGYYKKKVINIVRILFIWGVVTAIYSFFLIGNGLKTALFDGVKTALTVNIVPFWFLLTFILIYTVLLFSFDWIKQHIKTVVCILLLVCLAFDAVSMINISGGGILFKAMLMEDSVYGPGSFIFC